MITYHIIKYQQQIGSTTSLRTAKDKARMAGATAVIELQLTWKVEGYDVEFINCYIYKREIGVFHTYTLSELQKLHKQGINLLPTDFMHYLNRESQVV